MSSLFLWICGFFKCFCLVPFWRVSKNNDLLVLQQGSAIFNVTFVFGYWIGVVQSFRTNTSNKETISRVSNWMQLIMNAITLTVIILRPVLAQKIFKKINYLILKIDKKLDESPIKIKNGRLITSVLLAISFFVIYMTFLICFDVYVLLIKYKISSHLYWFLTILPKIIYCAGIWYAVCTFLCIYFRILACNEILKHEIKSRFVSILLLLR